MMSAHMSQGLHPSKPAPSLAVSGASCLVRLALATAMLMTMMLAGAQAQSRATPIASGVVYTANEHGNSVSMIDLASGQINTISIPISPHNVQVTRDGRTLLAVGDPVAGGHGKGDGHGTQKGHGRLLIFSTETFAKGPIAEVAVGAHPAHVVVDSQGERAFVTNAGDNTVTVIDLRKRTILKTLGTGRYPHGLRVSPNDREVYIANVQDGTLSVVDGKSLSEVARIPVGKVQSRSASLRTAAVSMSLCAMKTGWL